MDNVTKILLGVFKWLENTSQLCKYFVENYNEAGDEGHFFEFDIQDPQKLRDLRKICPFCLKE